MHAAAARAIAPARWLVRLEIGIWRSLILWTARRRPGSTPTTQSFTYARDLTPMLCAFIFVSVLEIPIVHLLLPWPSVRLAALVLSVWGLLWMLGYIAALRIYPHLVGDEDLRVRYGTTAEVRIPWTAVSAVSLERDRVDSNRAVVLDDGVARMAILKQTRIRVDLHGPTPVRLPDGVREIECLKLYADRPAELVTAARARLAAAEPAGVAA